MRPHEINQLDNFICGWYMDDDELCDNIIKYQQENKEKCQSGCVSTFDRPRHVDTSIKYSYDLFINETPFYQAYIDKLSKIVDQYHTKYEYSYMMAIDDAEGTNIQYYPPNGGYFAWHCERNSDQFPSCARHLVFMTYLNDVTDEGETEFFYQKVKVKPEKGLTLVWPADWTFTHRGIPSPTQEKWVVTGWLHYSSDAQNMQMLKDMGIV